VQRMTSACSRETLGVNGQIRAGLSTTRMLLLRIKLCTSYWLRRRYRRKFMVMILACLKSTARSEHERGHSTTVIATKLYPRLSQLT